MKSNKIKPIFLVLIILLPAVIFLFLKSFGSNQFDIPVYYQSGVVDTLDNNCGRSTAVPYLVNTKPASQVVHKIYHFEKSKSPELEFRLQELERIQNAIGSNNGVLLFSFLNNPAISKSAFDNLDDRINYDPSFWSIRPVNPATYDVFKNCELVMSDIDDRVVLVDNREQIRGYYDISDREETDRLIVELKILIAQENEFR